MIAYFIVTFIFLFVWLGIDSLIFYILKYQFVSKVVYNCIFYKQLRENINEIIIRVIKRCNLKSFVIWILKNSQYLSNKKIMMRVLKIPVIFFYLIVLISIFK